MPDARPAGGLQKTTHWNSPKRQRSLSLTDEAWSVLDDLYKKTGTNRTECVEILLRYAAQKDIDLLEFRDCWLH